MNDYNRGALPDPCLRLDYGFGDEWKSVELGDGTGYVRLSDYEKLKVENAKLRELVSSYASMSEYLLARQPMLLPYKANELQELDEKRHELGIEVDE